MKRSVFLNGLRYFAIVFSLGFVFGVIRVTWLVPRLGEARAELLEIPVMVACIFFIARWQVRCHVQSPRDWLFSGLLALALLLAFEFSVVLALRGLTLAEWLASRDPLVFSAYVASLLAFAVIPACLARQR